MFLNTSASIRSFSAIVFGSCISVSAKQLSEKQRSSYYRLLRKNVHFFIHIVRLPQECTNDYLDAVPCCWTLQQALAHLERKCVDRALVFRPAVCAPAIPRRIGHDNTVSSGNWELEIENWKQWKKLCEYETESPIQRAKHDLSLKERDWSYKWETTENRFATGNTRGR